MQNNFPEIYLVGNFFLHNFVFMKLIFIYVLINPETKTPFYVGSTGNPNNRYRKHILDSKLPSIQQLRDIGKLPIITIIQVCSVEERSERETYWITEYSINYKLENNHSKSGLGLGFGVKEGGTCSFIVRLSNFVYEILEQEAALNYAEPNLYVEKILSEYALRVRN